MLELYVRKTPRARKAYDCFLCGLPIPKGEKHVYEKGKWEGEFFTRRLHSACSNMVDFHLDETGSSEFTEDGVVETVREYICPYCPEKENCKLWPSWVPRCEEVVKEFTDECDACGK